MLKRIGGAFVVGAGIGAIGQILFLISGMMFEPGKHILPAMVVFGLLAAILVVIGVYEKIVKIGHAGAEAVISGLMFGAGMVTSGAKYAGASNGKAILAGVKEILKVMGTGFVLGILSGMVLNLK